jgi:DNA-binding transcriptional ArsR family regulator
MKPAQIVSALAALAHEHRLAVYRLLVEHGPDGLAAGVIADRIHMVPSSLTFHLHALRGAGLITQRRLSRQVFYAADYAAMNALIGYLTENCCGRGVSRCEPGCQPSSSLGKARKPRRAA